MADISKIILPNNSEYSLKDETALGDAIVVTGSSGTKASSDANEIRYTSKSGIDFTRRNGDYVNGIDFTDTYYRYGNANATQAGLLSADDYSFIDKCKKIMNATAEYTGTVTQDYISDLRFYGSYSNGIVVLSGSFASSGDGSNPTFASGMFPSARNSFVCGLVFNVANPNRNTRLLVRHEADGTSTLQCGGTVTAGSYFYMGVYATERCIYNLPYTL